MAREWGWLSYGVSVKFYLLRIDAPGEKPLPLGTGAVFHPDGNSVIWTENDKDLYRLALQKLNAKSSSHPGRGRPIAFSDDGR